MKTIVLAALVPMMAQSLPAETLLEKLAVQIPASLAVILLAYLFLNHMKGERKESQKFFEELQANHLDERKLGRESIVQNTKALMENVAVTQRNNDLLNQLSNNLNLKK